MSPWDAHMHLHAFALYAVAALQIRENHVFHDFLKTNSQKWAGSLFVDFSLIENTKRDIIIPMHRNDKTTKWIYWIVFNCSLLTFCKYFVCFFFFVSLNCFPCLFCINFDGVPWRGAISPLANKMCNCANESPSHMCTFWLISNRLLLLAHWLIRPSFSWSL